MSIPELNSDTLAAHRWHLLMPISFYFKLDIIYYEYFWPYMLFEGHILLSLDLFCILIWYFIIVMKTLKKQLEYPHSLAQIFLLHCCRLVYWWWQLLISKHFLLIGNFTIWYSGFDNFVAFLKIQQYSLLALYNTYHSQCTC